MIRGTTLTEFENEIILNQLKRASRSLLEACKMLMQERDEPEDEECIVCCR